MTGAGHTFEELNAGDYTAEVRVTDAAGNSATGTVSFTVIAHLTEKEDAPDRSDWIALLTWGMIIGALLLALLFTRKQKEDKDKKK